MSKESEKVEVIQGATDDVLKKIQHKNVEYNLSV